MRVRRYGCKNCRVCRRGAKLKIVALIISFNRLDMVRRCVESLRAQTRSLDAILVVDSSTTPEVRAWLETQNDVRSLYVTNEGSAGGVHHGLKWVLTRDYDWVWLFDDDVILGPDALAQLLLCLERQPEIQIINSLCVRENDPTRPSAGAIRWRKNPQDYLFGTYLETVEEIRAHADAAGLIDSVGGQLYQGTLMSRNIVQQVGVVAVEFFTRGDEVEYSLRIMRAGYHIPICIHSVARHPSSNTTFVNVAGKTLPVGRMYSAKRYYSIRNSLWIRKMYYHGHPFWLYVLKRAAAGMFQELFVEPGKSLADRFRGCGTVLRGVRDGLKLPASLQENVWGQDIAESVHI